MNDMRGESTKRDIKFTKVKSHGHSKNPKMNQLLKIGKIGADPTPISAESGENGGKIWKKSKFSEFGIGATRVNIDDLA